MTTETQILTDEFISALWDEIHASFSRETFRMSHHDFARHIEAAVLQSPEIQALRKKAAMVDYLEQHGGADISVLTSGEWEVCGGEIYGVGASLAEAFAAAMEQKQ